MVALSTSGTNASAKMVVAMGKMYDEFIFDNIDNDLEISPNDLDKEWLGQPQAYMKYAAASAHFRKLSDFAKEKVKTVEATLKADASEDPDSCLGTGVKATVDRVAAYATSHPEFIKAKKEAIEAEYRANMALNAVFAFQQRKDALENLVRLHSMEYFSSPDAKRDINRAFDREARHKAAINNVKQAKERKRLTKGE